MSASDLVKEWKAKAAQKAAERAAQVLSVPVTFAGFTGMAHRISMIDYARAGRMPQYLATAMFRGAEGQGSEVKESDVTAEQKAEWLKFQSVIFCAMMDKPKFSTDEMRRARGDSQIKDDEMDYAEFILMCPEAVQEGVQWQLDDCPDIPVATENGEVSVSALSNFRDSGEESAFVESSVDVPGNAIWWDTRATPRHL